MAEGMTPFICDHCLVSILNGIYNMSRTDVGQNLSKNQY